MLLLLLLLLLLSVAAVVGARLVAEAAAALGLPWIVQQKCPHCHVKFWQFALACAANTCKNLLTLRASSDVLEIL